MTASLPHASLLRVMGPWPWYVSVGAGMALAMLVIVQSSRMCGTARSRTVERPDPYVSEHDPPCDSCPDGAVARHPATVAIELSPMRWPGIWAPLRREHR